MLLRLPTITSDTSLAQRIVIFVIAWCSFGDRGVLIWECGSAHFEDCEVGIAECSFGTPECSFGNAECSFWEL